LKIRQCLEVLKEKKRTNDKSNIESIEMIDYVKILQEHENFHKFLEKFNFTDFVGQLDIHIFQDPSRENTESDDEFTQLLTQLSNSVADPRVIEMIAENLVKSDKL
jgi:hypothetical protein